ncbi:MAG TPA: hypothetical protein VJ549_02935 [Geothrix sp.]|nr:hypothetical protein [Geothrix sp.]
MKILMVGFGKIYYMSYMHFYLDQLKRTDHEVHLIYWDRDGKPDVPVPSGVTAHKFEHHMEDDVPKWEKLLAFWKYRKACLRLMDAERFDAVIVLTTMPGVVLADVLKKRFLGNYLFDYRDVTFENFGWFRRKVNEVARHAKATFVSSDAFRVYLTDKSIRTSHNILLDSLGHREVRRSSPRAAHPIRIRHWGLLGHEGINRQIIEKLANDPRFELHYHGREQEAGRNLKAKCGREGIQNVFFHGLYRPEERYEFAKGTDLLHNIFTNDIKTQPAMANKFYDGITFYLPQLCNVGSYMGAQVTAGGIGLECDPAAPTFADDLFAYYQALPWETFEANCDARLDQVLKEYQQGVAVITEFLNRP